MLTRAQNTGDDIVDNAFNYEFTHQIGAWAALRGYKGLKVPGARGNKDYINIVIFKQSDVDSTLGNISPIIYEN